MSIKRTVTFTCDGCGITEDFLDGKEEQAIGKKDSRWQSRSISAQSEHWTRYLLCAACNAKVLDVFNRDSDWLLRGLLMLSEKLD